MNIFNNPVLITLTDSDPFVTIQTYDQKHGHSQHFYLHKASLQGQLGENAEGVVTEADLLNFCTVARARDSIRFKFCWLHGNYDDDVCGYEQKVFLPINKAIEALNGNRVKHMSYSPVYRDKADIHLTPSAHQAIAAMDKMKRHALRKFFRDNFDYGRREHLVIQSDAFVRGFFFYSSVSKYNGGIVLHETEVIGKDGKPHRKVFYGLHT